MKNLSEFIQSAETKEQYPELPFSEIAVLGRSNAGKSSLLNCLLKREIVKTSSKPGKTRLINFFSKEGKYGLVDLPGYGYAGVSEKERLSWAKTIEIYLSSRQNLIGAIIVVDGRRGWLDEEKDLVRWLGHQNLPWVIAMTKIDKLSKSEVPKLKKQIQMNAQSSYVFETSSEKKIGIAELENFIFNEWVRRPE